MHAEFDLIQNYHEKAVFAAINEKAAHHPALRDVDMLSDIACVALNRLPPRYIRHAADFVFYLTDKERLDTERAIDEAVTSAIAFVLSRTTAAAR